MVSAVFALAQLAAIVPPNPLSHSSVGSHEVSASAVPATLRQPSTIVFVGDVLLARDVEQHQRRFGINYPFARISFPPSSYLIGNFESAIPPVHQSTPHFQMRFSTPTSSVEALRVAGFTHVSLANNHSLDFGVGGYTNTASTLREAGVIPFGYSMATATQPFVLLSTTHGTVAVLGWQTVTQSWSEAAAASAMAAAARVSDWQVAFMHWGPEYHATPSTVQQSQAAALVQQGADLIIGHHPHVVQGVDVINGVPVVYSLGNFVFDQYFSAAVQHGLVVTLDMTVPELRLTGVTSADSRTQPRYHTAEESLHFLESLAAKSSPALRADIVRGHIPLHWQVASSSKIATIQE